MKRLKPQTLLFAAVMVSLVLTSVAGRGEAQQPDKATILVTDVGQGNNAKIIRMLLKKNGIGDFKFLELAAAKDLEGIELMIVGVGASTKGLGAAGLDVEAERQRAESLLAAAKEKSIKTIGVHIGGKPRRGEISDALNELVMVESDIFVAWHDGNEDGFFTRLAKTRLGDDASEAALAELLRIVDNKRDVGLELKKIVESS